MKTVSTRRLLAASVCVFALSWGASAMAADAAAGAPGTVAGNGSEGTDVSELVITTERNQAAAAAPSKASLDETQPESIISRSFIEKFTPENGDYTTVVLIAPSIGGIASNGGLVGDTNKVTLRGFQDGQYNLTYDQISFGDTNDPTHHPSDYFPASTIGAAVVDRGPGSAGDIGQANYGGAIHLFSPTLSDTFNASEKVTYGSFNSVETVTTLQSGAIDRTGGTKILALFDYRGSDGEFSDSSGIAYNGLLKIVQPLGPKASVTLFSAVEYTRFFESDAASGETWSQIELYGKNFSLNNDPSSEFCKCYNHEKKNTDFEYIDFRDDFGAGVTLEDQGYTYFYSNKTISVDDNSGLVDGPNTSHPKDKAYDQTDIGGYNKGNRYRVYGDVFRLNKDWSFGTLKAGALVETSSTDRHNILYDLTTGAPDYHYSAVPSGSGENENVKTLEYSSWFQYQLFADFVWRPIDSLTITPGFKYVDFRRSVDGVVENGLQGDQTRGSVVGSNTYTKPLYFATINYKIMPTWSVYGQYATGFLVPSLSALYVDQLSLNNLKPSETVNYQAGTVYSRGRFTADADVYLIHVSNLEIASPSGQYYINAGNAAYSGVEGEAAYAFPFGLTVFANASVNTAKNTTADQTELNAPKWTDAVGALYTYDKWQASLIWKEVGSQVVFYNGSSATTTPDGVFLAANQARQISSYNTINASLAYDFGHFKMKVAAFNLADHRALTSITDPTPGAFYTFQAGRQVLVTLEAKFR
jgi:iron complex outermembrane receptor protein